VIAGLVKRAFSDTIQFVQIDLPLKKSDDYEAVTHSAYMELLNFIQQSPHTNLVRLWNHLPLINQGTGDKENYKLFCSGRFRITNNMKTLQNTYGISKQGRNIIRH
tara:strand:- start:102 stop:419 length:318 start_codon:yes stop_codon:yes gene_type:complete